MSTVQRETLVRSSRRLRASPPDQENLTQALPHLGVFAARPYWSRAIIPAILIVQFWTAAWICLTFNIWVDEYYSLHTTSRDFSFAVTQALRFEEQPPLYFMALWVWRQLNLSLFWGRLFSTICVLGFLIVAWRLVKRLFPQIHPAWIIGPMAVNPIVVYAATEMRVAGLTLLLTGLMMWFFFDGFATPKPRQWAAVAYGVVSVMALYTHYYLGFLLVGNGIALLLTRRWRSILLYYGIMGLVGLAFVPMVLAMPQQADGFAARMPLEISLFDGMRTLVERIQNYLWPAMGLYIYGPLRWIVSGAMLVMSIILVCLRARRAMQSWIVLYAIVLTTGMGLAFAASRFGWQSMLERHALPVLLPAYLCFYGIFYLFDAPVRRRMLVLWTPGLAIVTLLSLYAVFHPLAKSGDWKRVAAYIQANEQANEAILVFPADAYASFMYYYRGRSEVVAIPRPEQFIRYNHSDDMLKNGGEIAAAIGTVPYTPAAVWVLVNCDPANCGYLGVDYNLPVLEAFLAENFSVDKPRQFFCVSLRHGLPRSKGRTGSVATSGILSPDRTLTRNRL